MRKTFFTLAGVTMVVGMVWGVANAAEEKPKYTTKDVMAKAHKGKDTLLSKVSAGKATPEEAKELLGMYQALEMNKPPKGEDASWKEKTKALVDAANAAVDKKADASELLKKASNCMNCHSAHKGK